MVRAAAYDALRRCGSGTGKFGQGDRPQFQPGGSLRAARRDSLSQAGLRAGEQRFRRCDTVEIPVIARATFFAAMRVGRVETWRARSTTTLRRSTGSPGLRAAYLNRGSTYAGLTEWRRAIADYNRAIEMDTSARRTAITTGAAPIWQLATAMPRWRTTRGAAARSELHEGHDRPRRCTVQPGSAREAVAEYRAALRRSPESAAGLFYLGQAQYYDGDIDGAIPNLRRSLSINPDQARARLYLGQCYAVQGRRAEALDAIRAALPLATRDDLASSRADLENALANRPRSSALIAALDLVNGR